MLCNVYSASHQQKHRDRRIHVQKRTEAYTKHYKHWQIERPQALPVTQNAPWEGGKNKKDMGQNALKLTYRHLEFQNFPGAIDTPDPS